MFADLEDRFELVKGQPRIHRRTSQIQTTKTRGSGQDTLTGAKLRHGSFSCRSERARLRLR